MCVCVCTLCLHARLSLHMCIYISGEVLDRISSLLLCVTSLISPSRVPVCFDIPHFLTTIYYLEFIQS